jgi:hypothetical protein
MGAIGGFIAPRRLSLIRHSTLGKSSFLPISSRLELRRALSFSHGACDGDVRELRPIDGAAEKQSAPAHIAAADEIGGEAKAFSEVIEEDIDIFRRRDAAEENDLAVCPQSFGEVFYVTFERYAVTGIRLVDVHFREFLEIGEADRRCCRNEATCRRDDEDGRSFFSRRNEGIGVSELAAKIEAAEKCEYFSQCRRLLAPEAAGEIELGAFAHDHARALAAGIRRGEKKNAVHGTGSNCHFAPDQAL